MEYLNLYIASFIMFGDAELTVACARDLLKLAEGIEYDYLFTAEAKSIPLIHEMARQSGAGKYFIARKGPKAYMPDPIHVEDQSITTSGVQRLYLGSDDAALIRGKRILLMDDVISTGGSLKAMEHLVELAGGTVAGRIAVLAEGDAADRKDIKFLEKLPLFEPDGAYNYYGVDDRELYDLAVDMIRTEPGDLLGYCRKWVAFQERFAEIEPVIPIYSNIYFDFYPRVLQDYVISDYSTWSQAIVPAVMSDIPETDEVEEDEDVFLD